MGSSVEFPKEQLCKTLDSFSLLLAGPSSLDLLNWETYSNTQHGIEEPNFLVVQKEFRTTVHSNALSYNAIVYTSTGKTCLN